MKVFELAKELELPAKDVLEQVQKLGMDAKSNFATLDAAEVEKLKKAFKEPSKQAGTARKEGAAKAQLEGARKVRKRIIPKPVQPEAVPEKVAEASEADKPEEAAEASPAQAAPEKEAQAAPTAPAVAAEAAPAKEEHKPHMPPPRPARKIKVISQAERPATSTAGRAEGGFKDKPKGRHGEVDHEEEERKKHIKRAAHGHRKDVPAFEDDGDDTPRPVKATTATSYAGKQRAVKWVKPRGGKSARKEKSKHIFNARKKDIIITHNVTVSELASFIGVRANQIIKTLLELEIEATTNDVLDEETIRLIADEHNIEIRLEIKSLEDALEVEEDNPEDLLVRPPVVTVMGHVDHGKTSLLDYIRKANVTAGEAGGITQHIGAYLVQTQQGPITFLDTPGHAAFTAMRARGATATDIVILVVAADDGPRPQTIEAISHSQAAGVPIIVAINKSDKPDAHPDKVKQQLMEHELVAEDFGGDVPMIPVSAHTGEGVEKLLEMVTLQSEIMELNANPKRDAEGVVVESQLDKGRGNLCTLLVQKGTLKIGDCFVVGSEFGRVRSMRNDQGESITEALPSTPVEIGGLNGLPQAGDSFQVGKNEKTVRQIAEMRGSQEKEAKQAKAKAVSLENLFSHLEGPEQKNLNLIIKADVVGSAEALVDALHKLGNEEVAVKCLHSAVGAITQTDVALAQASEAIIIGFNVRPDTQAKKAAQNEQIDIRLYSVIYECLEDVTKALEGMLTPIVREELQGKAEILEVFTIPKVGVIAGSKVVEGKIVRDAPIRVFRDNVLIHDGHLASLQRFKDQAKDVQTGFECGIGVQSYKDLRVGDVLESYFRLETAATL